MRGHRWWFSDWENLEYGGLMYLCSRMRDEEIYIKSNTINFFFIYQSVQVEILQTVGQDFLALFQDALSSVKHSSKLAVYFSCQVIWWTDDKKKIYSEIKIIWLWAIGICIDVCFTCTFAMNSMRSS